eukprot:CAMPEP_0202912980 /NCGR_PEP_ID=MMETSP1392-20130828/59211_1 /ASSEMBLY_ACC=CAM_ASM_000868 /TAXON_ID=225041 /ORGANISM="Chlamydomonas chlamydogama, Strain SAG 11-48b" /LENGTH=77 /DNA_ID=CAMNT_0049604081 /DNA_START=135 /DNA_END=368 /DNA_ORIENTATION=+
MGSAYPPCSSCSSSCLWCSRTGIVTAQAAASAACTSAAIATLTALWLLEVPAGAGAAPSAAANELQVGEHCFGLAAA